MKLFYGIILVLMIFISACSQQPAAEPEPQPSTAPSTEVQPVEVPLEEPEEEVAEVTSNDVRYVGAGGFDPAELTISVGSAVTWINSDDKKGALIIFKEGKSYVNSNGLTTDEKFEHEFTEAGEYEFWWNIAFAGNSGKITVE